MNLNFKKTNAVGVSVSSEGRLEVIQIDYAHQKVLKYAWKDLEYDTNKQEIADLDYFKETLHDLLIELDIPKGSDIMLNMPTSTFNVSDYPAAMDNSQIADSILDEMSDDQAYKDLDVAISVADTGLSTLQVKKVISTIAKKSMLIEIAMQIKELGYKLSSIDVSVNSILNTLIYTNSVDCSDDVNWLLLVLESDSVRLLSMQGNRYTDCIEEKAVIGAVLGDEENYRTVVETVSPVLNNLPSKYLLVVSKTSLISAEVLANKLQYKAPIIHCESNNFSKKPLLDIDESIPEDVAKTISIDAIGAGIKQYVENSSSNINLYNEYLGAVYLSEKPMVIKFFGKEIVLSVENAFAFAIVIAIIFATINLFAFIYLATTLGQKNNELNSLKRDIAQMNAELEKNNNISSEIFDEDSEIRVGIIQNKRIYSYYSIVGTEIPQKLWLTRLNFDEKSTTIEGQADNLESIYSFFRSIKDYDTSSKIKLQKLELASKSNLSGIDENFDTDSILTSLSADFYQFKISDEVEQSANQSEDATPNAEKASDDTKKNETKAKTTKNDVPKYLPSETED